MSDERLRELERKWRASGDSRDGEAYRRELARQQPAPPACSECKDTGVIETGNNDLPCHCPAGLTAVFNVATGDGMKKMTGAEMINLKGKRRR